MVIMLKIVVKKFAVRKYYANFAISFCNGLSAGSHEYLYSGLHDVQMSAIGVCRERHSLRGLSVTMP